MQNDVLLVEKEINILVADDHKLLRDTWRILFESDDRFNVIGEAANGKEAIQLAQALRPDIIVMDVNMDTINGIEAAKAILKMMPQSKIIAVTMNTNLAVIRKLLRIGIYGYVSKCAAMDELTSAIVAVHHGVKYICAETKDLLVKTYVDEALPIHHILTFREITILQLVKDGLPSREIAEKLRLSTKTIEVHRYNILKKMKLKNTAELVNFCNSNELQSLFS